MPPPTEQPFFPWDIRPGLPLYYCVGCGRWYTGVTRAHHLNCLARPPL